MKLSHLAHIAEIAIIIFLCLHIFVFAPARSPSAYVKEGSNPTLGEPPDLEKEINSIEDILEDLNSLGCRLINLSVVDTKFESIFAVKDYTEFRRIAYNTKLVFFMTGTDCIYCFTLYQGFPIGFGLAEEPLTFTKTEELKITGHEWGDNQITLYVSNTGAAKLTLDYAEVNSVKKADADVTFNPQTLDAGQSGSVAISHTLSPGVRYELAIVTETGGRYTYIAVVTS